LSPSLADRLKTETRALHTAAERSTFMGELLRGRIGRSDYCALLRNLHAIYAALEPGLVRHASHALIAPVYAPALFRTAALSSDLTVLHGSQWTSEIAMQQAAIAYVARLHEVEATQPGLLLAHAYVRYLGDLSGGQMLRRIVGQSGALADERGLAFYDFGDASAARELAHVFRSGLASVPVDAVQTEALIAEAKLAFGLHQRLFDELAADAGLVPA